MDFELSMKVIKECEKIYDTLSGDEFSTWNFLVKVNNVVSAFEGVDCLMNLNFDNGNISQCMCLITDWEPVAIIFQSDDGELPRMRAIYPEEYDDFMEEIAPFFNSEYPEFPELPDDEE